MFPLSLPTYSRMDAFLMSFYSYSGLDFQAEFHHWSPNCKNMSHQLLWGFLYSMLQTEMFLNLVFFTFWVLSWTSWPPSPTSKQFLLEACSFNYDKRHFLLYIVLTEAVGIVQCRRQERMLCELQGQEILSVLWKQSPSPLCKSLGVSSTFTCILLISVSRMHYSKHAMHAVCLPTFSCLKKGSKWSHGGVPGLSPVKIKTCSIHDDLCVSRRSHSFPYKRG